MTDLTDVKINGEYEYIEATAPTAAEKEPAYSTGERWLDTSTGYSYILQDEDTGDWARTEKAKDNKALLTIDTVFNTTIEYLANYFLIDRNEHFTGDLYGEWNRNESLFFLKYQAIYGQFVFDKAGKTLTKKTDTEIYGDIDDIKAGDTIRIFKGIRNTGYLTVVSVAAEIITVSEDLEDEEACVFLSLANIPAALCSIIGRMVYYDVFVKGAGGVDPGLKSEKIGTYSYTMDDLTVGGNRYPSGVAGDLDTYQSIAMGGGSFYVE